MEGLPQCTITVPEPRLNEASSRMLTGISEGGVREGSAVSSLHSGLLHSGMLGSMILTIYSSYICLLHGFRELTCFQTVSVNYCSAS